MPDDQDELELWLAKPLVWVNSHLYIERLRFTKPRVSLRELEGVTAVLRPLFKDLPHERLLVLYGDAEARLVGARVLAEGSGAAVLNDMHALVRGAAFTCAHTLILAHNHPNQTLLPSSDDNDLTRKAAMVCAAMDVQMLDHFIMPTRGGGFYSYALVNHPALQVNWQR